MKQKELRKNTIFCTKCGNWYCETYNLECPQCNELKKILKKQK